jgi:hypothetical protein
MRCRSQKRRGSRSSVFSTRDRASSVETKAIDSTFKDDITVRLAGKITHVEVEAHHLAEFGDLIDAEVLAELERRADEKAGRNFSDIAADHVGVVAVLCVATGNDAERGIHAPVTANSPSQSRKERRMDSVEPGRNYTSRRPEIRPSLAVEKGLPTRCPNRPNPRRRLSSRPTGTCRPPVAQTTRIHRFSPLPTRPHPTRPEKPEATVIVVQVGVVPWVFGF